MSDLWLARARTDGEGISALVGDDQVVAEIRRFCDRLFARARDAANPGATWFVEKTPDNVNRLPMLAEAYPDAWFIHLVRDGRDVARSFAVAPFGPDDVGTTAAVWALDYERVATHAWRLPRFREIRYEALVADPVGTMTALFEWMGLELDDAVLARLRERAQRAVARFGETTALGEGKWRLLSDADLDRIYTAAGDRLAELGYLRQSL
ncbi:MAG: sulfotransferase [Acidimicrobiia bacterium]|nr:sulfotransferase [Acidimicrobiia bacterium]